MRKLVMLTAVIMFAFVSVSIGQRGNYGSRDADNRSARSEYRDGQGKCKKIKKMHKRKMRKMAAADGKVTPRERRMLRKNRSHVH